MDLINSNNFLVEPEQIQALGIEDSETEELAIELAESDYVTLNQDELHSVVEVFAKLSKQTGETYILIADDSANTASQFNEEDEQDYFLPFYRFVCKDGKFKQYSVESVKWHLMTFEK